MKSFIAVRSDFLKGFFFSFSDAIDSIPVNAPVTTLDLAWTDFDETVIDVSTPLILGEH